MSDETEDGPEKSFSDFDIHHPNDHFFRGWMGKPYVASGFFRHYLPRSLEEWVGSPEQLHLENATFVDEALRGSVSDQLWRCERPGTDSVGYIYILFEHQSAPDPEMPMRLLKYMMKIWERWASAENRSAADKYPFIFPVVLYQGKTDWNRPTRLSELIDLPGEELLPFQPDFEFQLVSLKDLNLENLNPSELRIGLEAMALAVHGNATQWVLQSFDEVDQAGINFIIRYVMAVITDEERSKMIKEVAGKPGKGPNAVLSGYEGILMEGRQEGRQEGRMEAKQDIARKLSKDKKFNPAEIAELLSMTESEVNQLLGKIK